MLTVGLALGSEVGTPVGIADGTTDGEVEGVLVGDAVGTSVGSPVGDGEGAVVGEKVTHTLFKLAHRPCLQSLSKKQLCPMVQGKQLPPQSTSVSSPF